MKVEGKCGNFLSQPDKSREKKNNTLLFKMSGGPFEFPHKIPQDLRKASV